MVVGTLRTQVIRARLWHPDYGRDSVVEMVKDGVLFRLPELIEPVPWAQGNRCIAAQNLTGMVAAILPKWYDDHASRGHPFRPDCDSLIYFNTHKFQASTAQVSSLQALKLA